MATLRATRAKGQAQQAEKSTSKTAKWLCVASGKGGNGQTSTSLNIAVFAAHAGLKVCMVDLDRQRTLGRWHERRNPVAPEIMLYVGTVPEVQQAITDINAVDNIDVVIVDTPPSLDEHPAEVARLLRRSDFVLVPTTQGTADLDSVIEWMALLKRQGTKAAFLLNRAQRNFATYRDARNRLVRVGDLCPVDIRQLEDVQRTHTLGAGVLEMARSAAAEDYQGLWDYLRNQMGISE
jgi:chromosome partitioning protein